MAVHFGTDGIRGRFGDTLTIDTAYRLGRFFGGAGFPSPKTIYIGRDTRESGEDLSKALIKGILQEGGTVLDLGVTSTPSISFALMTQKADFGIMISASHNPYYDNGLKVFAPSGEKLAHEIELSAEAFINGDIDPKDALVGVYKKADELKQSYLDYIQSRVHGDFSKLKILADFANGSACAVAPGLFERFGIHADILAKDPNGKNINNRCGSTHMEALREKFLQGNYDLGVCFDGDADRFLAIASDGRLIDGDALIYLGALALKRQGKLKGDAVVITVMSNFGLRKALTEAGIDFRIVSVGDKYVQACLKEEGLCIGGEQSGHVIYYEDLNTGDGLLSMAHLLEIITQYPDVYARLSDFVVYPQELQNVAFASRDELNEALQSPRLKSAIEKAEKTLGEDGRVLVRASGTETLLRVMVEANDRAICHKMVDNIVTAIRGH